MQTLGPWWRSTSATGMRNLALAAKPSELGLSSHRTTRAGLEAGQRLRV